MSRGLSAIVLALLGIVLLVAAHHAGVADDPSATMLGLIGFPSLLGGGYLWCKSSRHTHVSGK
jgi:hypothetical protein